MQKYMAFECSATQHVYVATEVDARVADMRKAFETSSTEEENKLRARVAELEQQLAFANDAAVKGETARVTAAGMEAHIAELEKALRDCPCSYRGDCVEPDPNCKRCAALGLMVK